MWLGVSGLVSGVGGSGFLGGIGGADVRRVGCGVSVVEADAGHAFAEAALFDEILFEVGELVVNEIFGLVDKANGDVGEYFGGPCLHEFAVELEGLGLAFAEFAHEAGFPRVLVPDGEIAGTKEVFVVVEQFFEARIGDVGQFNLGLFRGAAGAAAFEEILLAGPRGLKHLIGGPVAVLEELLGKTKGDVVDDFGFLEGF